MREKIYSLLIVIICVITLDMHVLSVVKSLLDVDEDELGITGVKRKHSDSRFSLVCVFQFISKFRSLAIST